MKRITALLPFLPLSLLACGAPANPKLTTADVADSGAPEAKPSADAAPHSPYTDLAPVLEPIRKAHDLPALAAAVVTPDAIESMGVVGNRKYGDPTPAAIDDPFHLGSDGKAMTAVAVAKVVDSGKLAWSTTVGEVFRDTPSMDPAYAKVTVADLLGHRSHFPASLANGLKEFYGLSGSDREQRDAYIRKALAEKPVADYPYSNTNFIVVAAMAERASGRAWEDSLREYVFAPLGMKGALLGTLGDKNRVDVPWPHVKEDGVVTPVPLGPMADNPPALNSAGRIRMPIGSWALFIRDQLQSFEGKGRLLTPESYKALHTPAPGADMMGGWGVAPGGKAFMHAGSNRLNYALVVMVPAKRLAILVVTNVADEKDDTNKACNEVIQALVESRTKH